MLNSVVLLLRCRPEYQFYLKMLQKQKDLEVGSEKRGSGRKHVSHLSQVFRGQKPGVSAQRTVNAPCGAERSISLSRKCRESGLDAKWGEREADLHAYHGGHAAESACLVLPGRTLPAR
ncbi:hypothetical protein E5288_WYG014712 [Bos mutus]|uniref:Uncharacterized protein n=1 Tax=Bos mutus TaxID=72004 RepID=A0A6B0R053_9CETA|nr:hypothetical protein [Bos mutus]